MTNTTIGKVRGRDSRGRFQEGSAVARNAGRKGGKQAQANRTAHRLTKREQSKGGANSHTIREQ
jgi:hypothetical protein